MVRGCGRLGKRPVEGRDECPEVAGNVIPRSFQKAALRYVLQTGPVAGKSGAPSDRFAVGAPIRSQFARRSPMRRPRRCRGTSRSTPAYGLQSIGWTISRAELCPAVRSLAELQVAAQQNIVLMATAPSGMPAACRQAGTGPAGLSAASCGRERAASGRGRRPGTSE